MSSLGVTIYGVGAVSFMMAMYALERRGRVFIALFALGCLLSSAYGFLSGAWPFGVVEFVWSGIALRRYAAAGRHRVPDGPGCRARLARQGLGHRLAHLLGLEQEAVVAVRRGDHVQGGVAGQ